MNEQSQLATMRAYVSGFALSLIFTLTAYELTTRHGFGHRGLILSLSALALAQFLAQLFFFLHLGRETKPRWKLLVFGFMILVVMILVIGSLWIMSNLNTRMMSPQAINRYLQNQDGL